MNARERIEAVLHLQKPDKVPFAPYDEMIPRGDFARELRNRGMGIQTYRTCIHWSECPDVTVETRLEGDMRTTIYHTPVGSVSTRTILHTSRKVVRQRVNTRKGMMESVDDYKPVIFMTGAELEEQWRKRQALPLELD